MKIRIKKRYALSTLLLLLSSCSKIPVVKDANLSDIFDKQINADGIIDQAIPEWFEDSPKFRIEHYNGRKAVHMFYDMKPDLDKSEYTVNYIAVTPEGSEVEYGLNLQSGQHFSNRLYCHQTDIWKSYKEIVYKPPFNLGVIPRMLDEQGDPQKIYVLDEELKTKEHFLGNIFDAKIIGGIIEQFCPEGTCFRLEDWKRRLVLIGVQPDVSRFKKVNSLEDLKKQINWVQFKAFVENGQGKNKVASSFYPAYRLSIEVEKKRAIEYLTKNSIHLKEKNLNGVKKNCHILYDKIWNEVATDSDFEKKIKTLKSLKERKAFLKNNAIDKKSLFHHRFKQYFQKYQKDYKTCLKYIYPSNINEDPERHWFFAYFSAVHLLHDIGYTFNCSRGGWVRNPLNSNGKRMKPLSREFKGCSAKKIDIAFEQSVNYLGLLEKKNLESYRYIDYDKGSFGTHQKIYTWVKVDNKQMDCKKSSPYTKRSLSSSFPKDVSWKRKGLSMRADGSLIKE